MSKSFAVVLLLLFGFGAGVGLRCAILVAPLPEPKSQTKLKEIAFNVPLYDADVCYLTGGTVKDLRDYIKAKHGPVPTYSWGEVFVLEDGTDAYQFHVTSPLGEDERFYVWIHEPNNNLLFHETLHLTFDILWVRQVYYKSESEEAFAYLGGWLFDEAIKRDVLAK